jgi:hypothetical protein
MFSLARQRLEKRAGAHVGGASMVAESDDGSVGDAGGAGGVAAIGALASQLRAAALLQDGASGAGGAVTDGGSTGLGLLAPDASVSVAVGGPGVIAPPRVSLADFQMLKVIGKGSFGKVYWSHVRSHSLR